MSASERETFIIGSEFESALSLLALVVGAPSIAPTLIKHIYGDAPQVAILRQIRNDLKNHMKENAQSMISSQIPIGTRKSELYNAIGIIELLIESGRSNNEVNKWVLQIIRHSFRPTVLDSGISSLSS